MRAPRPPVDPGEDPVAGFDFDLWGDADPEREEPAEPDPELEPERASREPGSGPSDAVRIAWSAAYMLRAAVALAVLAVTAVLMTMVMDPYLTLVEAVNLYMERIGEFAASLGK